MKKLGLLCVPLAVCCLSGCSAANFLASQPPDFDKAYTACAEIDYGKFKAAADVTRSGKGEWEFSFTEPKYLSGMKIGLSDSGISASLGDLKVEAENTNYYTAMPELIAEAVDALSEISSEAVTEQDGLLTLSPTVGGKKAIITAEKDGSLVSLKCPSQKLSVKFSEYAAIESIETIETDESTDGGGIEII